MELRDFFIIFIVHKKIFWGIIIACIICGMIIYFVQKQTYETSLTINITRNASERIIDEYTYDDFYRLQADAQFADTVVRWTQAPYIIEQVFGNIKNNTIFGSQQNLHAKRLSSQVVDIAFVTSTKEDARVIAKKLIMVLNEESQKLNAQQKQNNWFAILGSEPVIRDNNASLIFLFLISTAIGFFVAFWVVMMRHYFIGTNK